MAWTNPVDPVTNTVITVAYAVANILTQIRWLRILTGNADPPGSNYTIRSASTTSTDWSKVTTDMLDTNAVTTAKILDGTIIDTKLALLTITGGKVANNTLDGDAKLVVSSVTGNSGTSAIGANTIHANRIAANTFDATQVAAAFATGALDATNAADIIAANAINGDAKLVAGSVTGNAAGSAIGSDTVHSNRLATSSMSEAEFDRITAAGIVDSDRIKGASFTETEVDRIVAAGAIDSDRLKNDSITATQIAANAIGSSELADNAVDTNAIAALAVTGAKIAADTIDASKISPANRDGTTATASLRTLGTGAQQAAAGDHAHDSTYLKLAQAGGSQDITFSSGTVRVGENAGDLLGGGFAGLDGIAVVGNIVGSGIKSRLATGKDGQRALLHALESAAPHFEDWGRARLVGGEATIEIPADFANYVTTDDYHVFLTAEGMATLCVPERTPDHFTVRALTGDLEAPFSWRLVARQRDFADEPRLRGMV